MIDVWKIDQVRFDHTLAILLSYLSLFYTTSLGQVKLPIRTLSDL